MNKHLDGYRPRFLRKSYPSEPFPVDGENGAFALLRGFGLTQDFGAPTEAVAFRDETGRVRQISTFFPAAGFVIEVRVNRHVSSVVFRRLDPGFHPRNDLMPQMAWAARNFRARGL